MHCLYCKHGCTSRSFNHAVLGGRSYVDVVDIPLVAAAITGCASLTFMIMYFSYLCIIIIVLFIHYN